LTRRSPRNRLGFPSLFRRRLTIAFVLVAAVAAGLVAVTSYLVVHAYRTHTFVERATNQARLAMTVASLAPESTSLAHLVEMTTRTEGVDAIARRGEQIATSRYDLDGVDLRSVLPERGSAEVTAMPRTLRGVPYLLVGGSVKDSPTDLYLVFSRQSLFESLRTMRGVLLGTGLGVVALAALVGGWVARRTLDPVQAAAQAASSVAEGLLDTRLPVRGGDEFAMWAQAFNEMAAALEDKIQALSDARDRERRFTADVAHELRTPLSALVSAGSLLAQHMESMPLEARRPAELLVEGIGRLRRLVGDLLELSRIDAGHGSVDVEAVELGEVAAGVVELGGWRSEVSCGLEPAWVAADRRRVERIVFNLVANAVQHGKRDVQVRTFAADGHGVFEVRDHGPGIRADDLHRVFDRFYKADRSRSGAGSGLGLSIARENARLMGAAVEVGSVPGEGTCFAFRLPLWSDDAVPEQVRRADEIALR
jgi:signal transduction histidine kinase